jgi:hypothetical protein
VKISSYVLAFGLLIAAASPAAAGIIELTFTGIVQATPTDNIAVRQPDGSYGPYTGTNAPTYPVTAGDTVTVTFKGTAPDVNGPALPPGGVDGIYRFPLNSPAYVGANPLAYNVSGIDVGGFGSSQGTGGERFGAGGFDLVYNSRTGEYAIDLGTDGIYSFGYVSLPSYRHDPVADLFTPGPNCGRDRWACPSSSARGTIDTLTFSNINMYGPDGYPIGALGPLVLVGSFNLPTYALPAQVDAPAAAPLFAGGLAILGWRMGRRRRRR